MYFGRCLVVGGGGWLGRHLIDVLLMGCNEVEAANREYVGEGAYDAVFHLAPCDVEPYLARANRGSRTNFVLCSSGAVVKKSDAYLDGYVGAKREAEAATVNAGGQVARLYSVLGPGIPLDAHYAASSFLSQATSGGPVVVHDGAIRSYLHPKDVASALLIILAHGDSEPYDVGGEEPITVADLGRRIAIAANVACHLSEPFAPDIYLPDLTRLHALGWRQTIGLDAMIEETLESLGVTPRVRA